MKVRVLKRIQIVPRRLEEAYEIFSNPHALETLTPSAMHFRLLDEKLDTITPGTVLNYRFYLYRLPMRWQVRIDSADAPNSFCDVQQKGPFAHWKHTQTFVYCGPESTEVRDRFEFALRFGRLGEFAYRTFLKGALRQIIDYRSNKIDLYMHSNPPKPAKVTAQPAPRLPYA